MPAREVEAQLSSRRKEGFIQWMLQSSLVNPVQAMDLEKVQAAGQKLLAAVGTGSNTALQHIPVWGPYRPASRESGNPGVFGQQWQG